MLEHPKSKCVIQIDGNEIHTVDNYGWTALSVVTTCEEGCREVWTAHSVVTAHQAGCRQV